MPDGLEKMDNTNNPMSPMEKRQTPNEGEIHKVQRNTFDKEAYDEDFEVRQENEIARNAAKPDVKARARKWQGRR